MAAVAAAHIAVQLIAFTRVPTVRQDCAVTDKKKTYASVLSLAKPQH